MIAIVVCSLFLASVCRTSASPFDRVVGGLNANIRDYAYQVSFKLNQEHFCGGSIIGQRWILTSANCFVGRDLNRVSVVVGTSKLNLGGTPYKIGKVISHEYFNPNNLAHDIAVVQVTQKIITSNKVRIIGLSYDAQPDNTPCTFSGWGLTSYPSEVFPNNLQYIELNTIPLQLCASSLATYPVYTTHICTYKTVGQGVCLGDGGGALVSDNVQIGVLSWGIYCARGSPDVFTSVPAYRQWIKSKTGI